MATLKDRAANVQIEFAKLEAKTSELVKRLMRTDNPTLIQVYEGEVKKIELKRSLCETTPQKRLHRSPSLSKLIEPPQLQSLSGFRALLLIKIAVWWSRGESNP